MASWFHSAILATTFAATVAVGLASAHMLMDGNMASPKADRLHTVADNGEYLTVETRQDGVSVLNRIQVN
jgi:hypothetical protein